MRTNDVWSGSYAAGMSLRSLTADLFRRVWLVTLAALGVGLVGQGLVVALVAGSRHTPAIADPLSSVALHLLLGAVALSLLEAFAFGLGWHLRTVPAAVAGVSLLTVLRVVWDHALASYPSIARWNDTLPFGSAYALVDQIHPTRTYGSLEPDRLLLGLVFATLVCLALVRVPVRAGHGGGSWFGGWPSVAGVVLALVSFGAVVPQWVQDGLPWYQTPLWHLDKHVHRAADDIAAEFIGYYQEGAEARSSALVRGRDLDSLLGPYARRLRSAGPPQTIEVNHDSSTPGAITAYWPDSFLNLCLDRSSGRWLIDQISEQPCPPK